MASVCTAGFAATADSCGLRARAEDCKAWALDGMSAGCDAVTVGPVSGGTFVLCASDLVCPRPSPSTSGVRTTGSGECDGFGSSGKLLSKVGCLLCLLIDARRLPVLTLEMLEVELDLDLATLIVISLWADALTMEASEVDAMDTEVELISACGGILDPDELDVTVDSDAESLLGLGGESLGRPSAVIRSFASRYKRAWSAAVMSARLAIKASPYKLTVGRRGIAIRQLSSSKLVRRRNERRHDMKRHRSRVSSCLSRCTNGNSPKNFLKLASDFMRVPHQRPIRLLMISK